MLLVPGPAAMGHMVQEHMILDHNLEEYSKSNMLLVQCAFK